MTIKIITQDIPSSDQETTDDSRFDVRHVKAAINFDLTRPDETEVGIVSMAHDLSMSKVREEAVLGLILKGIGPGFCWSLKETFGKNRKEDLDAQHFICGMTNASAALLAMAIGSMIKEEGFDLVLNDVSAMFKECVRRNLNKAKEELSNGKK